MINIQNKQRIFQMIAKSEFTDFTKESNWVSGKTSYNDIEYKWSAKLYDEPSTFGINDGRVSKLEVINSTERIIHYDRGWDIKPKKADHKNILRSILKLCEDSPKRFE
jgi:hypothetical protein